MEKIVFLIILLFYTAQVLKKEQRIRNISQLVELKKKYLTLSLAWLFLFCSLRHLYIGPDTWRYYLEFQSLYKESFSQVLNRFVVYVTTGQGKDEGYALIEKLFQIFIPSFRLFMSLVYFIYFYALYKFLYRHTSNITQCLVAILLFLALFLSVLYVFVRPVLAYAILIASIKYIEERRLFLFIFLVVIATLVHVSAIVFLPFYFVAYVKKVWLWMVAIGLIVPFLVVNMNTIITAIAISSDSQRIAYFAEGGEGAGTPIFTILLLLLLLTFLLMRQKILKNNIKDVVWGNALFVSVAMAPMTWFDQNMMRLLINYTIMLTILLGKIVYSVENPRIRRLYKVTICVALIMLIFKEGINSEYAFFWQDTPHNQTYIDYGNNIERLFDL